VETHQRKVAKLAAVNDACSTLGFNGRMSEFGNHIDRVVRDFALKNALDVAERHIVRRQDLPTRRLSGVAVISGERVMAKGLRFALPLPLVGEHDPCFPLGVVTSVTVKGDQLFFQADLCNSRQLPSPESVWEHLLNGVPFAASIAWRDAVKNADGVVTAATLEEISLCEAGRDPGARVQRCWQRDSVLKVWPHPLPQNDVIFDEESHGR
jgi:hypothetical protein